MNKAREVQIIFKTVQEAGKQPIRRRHWQFWLPHLSSILEGRWQCKFFKAKPWILINISGCVPKLGWWPTIQLVQYLNFCATFLLPLYPRGHPHCVVAKGHVCDQRIQGGGGEMDIERTPLNSLDWADKFLFLGEENVSFKKGWMMPSKIQSRGYETMMALEATNGQKVGVSFAARLYLFICSWGWEGVGCLIRWCRYFMLPAQSFSEEPLEKKFLIYIVMVSFFIWATTTLTAWVEVQDSWTIFRIFQGWAPPYKPPYHPLYLLTTTRKDK